MKLMNEKREQFESLIESKMEKVLRKIENIDKHKLSTYDQIDKYFEELIKKAKQRCQALKSEFDKIELKEKQRLDQIKEKIDRDLEQVKTFSTGFLQFFYHFDEQSDFNSNKATYSKFLRDLEKIKDSSQKKPYYFKLPKHSPTLFNTIDTDLNLIDKMGKIMDNSSVQTPLVVFNTQQFGLFEYREKAHGFVQLPIVDEENLSEKMPKNFKSVYIGNESFFIAGGFDAKAAKSSKRAFLLTRGKIQDIMEMYKARYINKGQALDNVEKYSLDKKEWEQVASLNHRRINSGACTVGNNHIFVFGGRNETDVFYDSVERLNIELNLWNLLKVKLPRKLCNVMAFTFQKDYIVILGGLKKFQGGIGGSNEEKDALMKKKSGDKNKTPEIQQIPEYEIERNVYLYNQSKDTWFQLKSLPQKHKICNAVHNENGKFYLFLLDQNTKSDLPINLVYDLKNQCPKLDRFWNHEYMMRAMESRKQQMTNDIFISDRSNKHGSRRDLDPYQKAIDSKLSQGQAQAMTADLRQSIMNQENSQIVFGNNKNSINQHPSNLQNANNQINLQHQHILGQSVQIQQKKEPQVFELKEINSAMNIGLDGQRDNDLDQLLNDNNQHYGKQKDRGFKDFDDDLALDMLKLEDNFSRINESSFLKDLPPQFLGGGSSNTNQQQQMHQTRNSIISNTPSMQMRQQASMNQQQQQQMWDRQSQYNNNQIGNNSNYMGYAGGGNSQYNGGGQGNQTQRSSILNNSNNYYNQAPMGFNRGQTNLYQNNLNNHNFPFDRIPDSTTNRGGDSQTYKNYNNNYGTNGSQTIRGVNHFDNNFNNFNDDFFGEDLQSYPRRIGGGQQNIQELGTPLGSFKNSRLFSDDGNDKF
eukprot:403354304